MTEQPTKQEFMAAVCDINEIRHFWLGWNAAKRQDLNAIDQIEVRAKKSEKIIAAFLTSGRAAP